MTASTRAFAGLIVGQPGAMLWGLSSAERLTRQLAASGAPVFGAPVGGDGCATIAAHQGFAFDPLWFDWIKTKPGTALIYDGVPVLAHARPGELAALTAWMQGGLAAPDMQAMPYDGAMEFYDQRLRKRTQPFLMRLTPENVPALERVSYASAYKGVTDALTKWLWPGLALQLTRMAAARHITPNQITVVSIFFCLIAALAFWQSWYWTGLAFGWAMMVLDTVDGKLARVTITSSKLGNLLDHGTDLVHPPFWYWAWGAGLAGAGDPLPPGWLMPLVVLMFLGYCAGRAIEGLFLRLYAIDMHIWQRLDSSFRLITARRNPNMAILTLALLAEEPAIGFILVVIWTVLCALVHLVRLFQAMALAGAGLPIRSWLD